MTRPTLALAAILFAASLSGCSDAWDEVAALFEPAPDLSDDPRLGIRILEGSPFRRSEARLSFSAGRMFVGVYEAAGNDTGIFDQPDSMRFYAVDPASRQVSEFPAPPALAAGLDFKLWPALSPGTVAVTAAGDPAIHLWNGVAWTRLELPPGAGHSDLQGAFVANSGTVFLNTRARVLASRSGTWVELLPDRGGFELIGPVDSSRFRVLALQGTTLEAHLFDLSTLAPVGQPVVYADKPVQMIHGSAINGYVDNFQVLADLGDTPAGWRQLLTYVDGKFVPGDVTGLDALLPRPLAGVAFGYQKVTGELARPPIPAVWGCSGGRLQGKLLERFDPFVHCECSRAEDRGCDCIERPLVAAALYGSFDHADKVAVLAWDDVDGRRRLYARVVDLPSPKSALAGESCTLSCADLAPCEFHRFTGEPTCLRGDSQEEPQEWPLETVVYDSSTNPDGFIGGVFVKYAVHAPQGPQVEIEVRSVGPEEGRHRFVQGGVEVDPYRSYVLTFSGLGLMSLASPRIDTEMHGSIYELGTIYLPRGAPIGPDRGDTSPNGNYLNAAAAVKPGGGPMVVASADGWQLVEAASPDPGFTVRRLGDAPAKGQRVHPAVFTPDGGSVLLQSPGNLLVASVAPGGQTHAVAGDHDLSQRAFAMDAPVLAVRRGPPHPALFPQDGGVDVIRLSATGPQLLLSVNAPGNDEVLSATGKHLFRTEGAVVVSYETATGARTVWGGFANADPQLSLLPGHDDSTFFVIEPAQLGGGEGPGQTIPACGLRAGCPLYLGRWVEDPEQGLIPRLTQLSVVRFYAPSTAGPHLLFLPVEQGLSRFRRLNLDTGETIELAPPVADFWPTTLVEHGTVALTTDSRYPQLHVLDFATGAKLASLPATTVSTRADRAKVLERSCPVSCPPQALPRSSAVPQDLPARFQPPGFSADPEAKVDVSWFDPTNWGAPCQLFKQRRVALEGGPHSWSQPTDAQLFCAAR